MDKKFENSLIIVKDDIFFKIRRNLFAMFFKKENQLLNMIKELEKPKNIITGNIVVPKEIKLVKK